MKTFDRDKALAIADGDAGLMEELINLSKQQSPQLLSTISKALETGRLEDIVRPAHTLKGSAANVGASAAYEIAVTLETMALNGDTLGASEAYERLVVELQRFEQETAQLERTTE